MFHHWRKYNCNCSLLSVFTGGSIIATVDCQKSSTNWESVFASAATEESITATASVINHIWRKYNYSCSALSIYLHWRICICSFLSQPHSSGEIKTANKRISVHHHWRKDTFFFWGGGGVFTARQDYFIILSHVNVRWGENGRSSRKTNHLQAELELSHVTPELGSSPQQWDDSHLEL